jgi:hypothetical protein
VTITLTSWPPRCELPARTTNGRPRQLASVSRVVHASGCTALLLYILLYRVGRLAGVVSSCLGVRFGLTYDLFVPRSEVISEVGE